MFFGNPERSRARRRGVVLILVLGMLALMALIGVTFATFAGQSLVSNRNFAQSVNFPTSDQVMDYALAQLINDTNNPTSALRGHSLLRDMYGNDSLMSGNSAAFRALLTGLPDGTPLQLTAAANYNTGTPNSPFNLAGHTQYATNIPVFSLNPSLYNVDFTRWILSVPAGTPADGFHLVASTYEILDDNRTGSTHLFTLTPIDGTSRVYRDIYNRGGDNPKLYNSADIQNPPTFYTKLPNFSSNPLASISANIAVNFTLDGRYMRAFNGTGMSHHNAAGVPYNTAAYANFRTNGNLLLFAFNPSQPISSTALGDPSAYGMDEDYDACDLENWFLALQSADGQVMIPSFHRPGILTAADWTNAFNAGNDTLAAMSISKILRPRQVDNSLLFPIDPIPDATGKIKYDVDNDGDGVTDSVWLDLGFPAQRDGRGLTFRPLFAFMVIGLNGRLPLNTVGNLQSRDFQTKTSTGMPNIPNTTAPFNYEFGPQNLLDGTTWSHASHLGFSVNEISPLFALQNASDLVFNTPANRLSGNIYYSQHDNSSVAFAYQNANYNAPGATVDVIQLRNLLAGTVPQDNLTTPTLGLNNDTNWVFVNNQKWYMPNSMYDSTDNNAGGTVIRGNDPVMGRWGERNGIPKSLAFGPFNYTTPQTGAATITSLVYTNPVRAGRSGGIRNGSWIPSDATDDDYDAFDFFPFGSGEGTYDPTLNANFGYGAGDYYDQTGSLQLPVERIRRFVTPIDPAGVGRVVAWNQRPVNAYDYGLGFDSHGRTGFFRYFRPAGVPKVVTYDTNPAHITSDSRYLQPIMKGPALGTNAATDEWRADLTNNRLHGWQSQAMPLQGIGNTNSWSNDAGIAVMAAMPWDFTNGQPASYYGQQATPTPAPYPKIVLPNTTPASANDLASLVSMTPNINTGQGPLLPFNDPSYSGDAINMGNFPAQSVVNSYPNYPVHNGNNPLASASLNKDEADEMNLYVPNLYDAPFGPSDLEWLYRTQDVDGASLDSRLKHLAPISFLNPADGSTRRRLFSTDSWDLINFAFSPDNPFPLNSFPYNQPVSAATFTQDPEFTWNSRFITGTGVNASLAAINYNQDPANFQYPAYQNITALTQFPNPVSYGQPVPTSFPFALTTGTNNQLAPISTPTVAHRDRKINLNYPLPISNDTTEPVRQKWIRETYQFFKAILPPQAVDTPEELAQLSQFVVNIVDFRDPDCSATRFVNTDLMVEHATATPVAIAVNPSKVVFANLAVPTVNGHYPYDPTIYDEQVNFPATTRNPTWQNQTNLATPPAAGDFLVQYGMEYNPIALNEVLATYYPIKVSGASVPMTRFAIEVVNTLTDDGINPSAAVNSSSDLDVNALDGWDFVVTADNVSTSAGVTIPTGRPDPITGQIPPEVLKDATTNNRQAIISNANPLGANEFTFTNFIYGMRTSGPTGGRTGQNNTNGYFQFGLPLPTGATVGTAGNNNETYGTAATTSAFPTNDATFPTTFALPTPPANTTAWYWVYLRRPANPFDTSTPRSSREMVVVDSMRFPYANGGTVATTSPDQVTTQGTQKLFSTARLQPYRGGHHVPRLTAAALNPSPPWAWGYSEQTAAPNTSANYLTAYFGNATTSPGIVATVYHSINQINPIRDPSWDYIPFHDRDFMSPAELLLVPGCSPGLFTKQFVYENDSTLQKYRSVPDGDLRNVPTSPPTSAPFTNTVATSPFPDWVAAGFNANTPRTYPYLNDEFFYTGASVAPHTNPPTNTAPYPARIGGITGDGWHKLLEFVEVPSSANGAIGPVASGSNFDWYRQDTKPGLLNLNLIIDEEVFFGLLDDARLNQNLAFNVSPLPMIVTQIDAAGYPAFNPNPTPPIPPPNYPYIGAYFMANRGFTIINPTTGVEMATGMKAAFSDFLKLRSGGSGFLFGWGSGMVGSGGFAAAPNAAGFIQAPIAQERPFRSLSYPDINYTIMRPAMLPPSLLTNPPASLAVSNALPYVYGNDAGTAFQDQSGNVLTAPATFTGDPGVRNPFQTLAASNPRLIPTVPLRRLFQIPDFANGVANTGGTASGAAEYGFGGAAYNINQPIQHPQLSDNSRLNLPPFYNSSINPSITTNVNSANLFLDYVNIVPPGGPAADASGNSPYLQINHYLGANVTTPPPPNSTDNRQHPYFRTEMMQKVMNLTTVRTHQFAVWITVGFFEVIKTGSPALGVPDILGGELGLFAGKNVRYRSFFLLDRTRAVGFNPSSPQDFRDIVTYRRRIE
jgi:hypothetical protein